MIHAILSDARFFALLQHVDEDIAAQAKARGCPRCGGRLDVASYPRKPRGALVGLGPGYDRRLSLCCSREGCRRRVTPPSIRFLGRSVYLGAVVVLASAMLHGVAAFRLSHLRSLLGVSLRTLKRWRAWWVEVFGSSPFFTSSRAFFSTPVDEATMPLSLLEAFGWPEQTRDALLKMLTWLRPITCFPHLRAPAF